MKNQNEKEKFKQDFKRRLYTFVLKLIEFLDGLNKKDRVCWVIGDQLLRSGTSILSNYIEAQSSSSKKEFINFFNISLKSINESKVWFCLLRDTNRTDRKNTQWFLDELEEFGKIFGSSILTLKGKK